MRRKTSGGVEQGMIAKASESHMYTSAAIVETIIQESI